MLTIRVLNSILVTRLTCFFRHFQASGHTTLKIAMVHSVIIVVMFEHKFKINRVAFRESFLLLEGDNEKFKILLMLANPRKNHAEETVHNCPETVAYGC